MKLKKLSYLLVTALMLSSASVVVKADTDTSVIESVVVSEEVSNGNTVLVPKGILKSESENLEERLGSITIELEDIEGLKDKSNVVFTISKVADVVDGEYKLLEEYSSVGIDLNNIQNSKELEEASRKLSNVVSSEDEVVTDNSGVARLINKEVGVYLVIAKDIAKYENITPFLVSIPYWDEVNIKMSYDIKAIPKHSPIPTVDTPRVPNTYYNNKAVLYSAIGGGFIGLALVLGLNPFKNRKKVRENQ